MSESDRSDQHAPPVSGEQLRAYLQSRQWFEDGSIRNIATIWHRQDYEDAEVVLPSADAKDFRERMYDALSAIAAFEECTASDVVRNVKRRFLNVISVRVINADTNDGTIPISDGVLLISKAKDMLSAAAHAVYAKRKQFSGATPKEARSYLETLLLGQTEIGSYIVNVIAPNQTNAFFDHPVEDLEIVGAESLAQVITSSLVAGLQALEKASARYQALGELRAFDEAVMSGASSNLCDALLGFSGEKRSRTFELTVSMAASPMFETEPLRFKFERKHIEALEQASDYYKNDYVLPDRTLTGYITKLVRPKDETAGTITLDSFVQDADRKLRVELTGDDYHLAVIAHDKGQIVRVRGDVHIKSKSAELLNPKDFGIIQMDDLL